MLSRLLTRVSAALLFALSGSLAAQAAGPLYDSIIVFGDSYNDVGNIHTAAAAFGISYPPAPYYKGRFSNGPIWLDHLASNWGLPLTPSLLGGTDYAFGGAELLQPVTLDGLTIPSVEDQVGLYLASTGGKADPKALYVIEGGGNDILDATTYSPTALGGSIAAGIYGIEHTLRLAGATRFLIPDLIDVGELPAAVAGGPEFVAFADATAIYANQALDTLLKPEGEVPGISLKQINVFRTFRAVANDTSHFGFKDVTDPCLTPTTECSDASHTLWWDDEHPTTFGHAFFAVLVEGALANH